MVQVAKRMLYVCTIGFFWDRPVAFLGYMVSSLMTFLGNAKKVVTENIAVIGVWTVMLSVVGILMSGVGNLIKEGNRNKEADHHAQVFQFKMEDGTHLVGFHHPPKFLTEEQHQEILHNRINEMYKEETVSVTKTSVKGRGVCATIRFVEKANKKIASK